MKMKKLRAIFFSILFLIGILIILKSNSWDMGSIESMNLAGSIMAIFSGMGLLCEFYISKE